MSPAANRQDSLNNIFKLSAWFVEYIKHNTAAGHYDINLIAEDIFIPVFH